MRATGLFLFALSAIPAFGQIEVFTPSAPGKYHPIQVKVASTSGTDVRYRQGYVASEAVTAPPTGHSAALTLDDIFDDPLDASAVGLAAIAKPVPNQPGMFSILVRVNIADLHLEATGGQWTGAFDLAIQLPGSSKAKVHRFEIHAKEDKLRELIENRFAHQESIEIKGTEGMVRVAVQDRNTGAAGSVSIPVVPAATP